MHHVVAEAPTSEIARARLEGAGTPAVDLMVQAGLAPSKGQARRDVEAGGLYINNVRVDSPTRSVTANDLLLGQYVLLRRGKRSYAVVRVPD